MLLCVSEIGYGMYVGSLGLISDGVHSFANCLGVGTSLLAMRWSSSINTKHASAFSYGICDRAEVLAAFANSVILILLAMFLVSEALHASLGGEHTHHTDHSDHVAVVAMCGMVVNIVGLRLLAPHLRRGFREIFSQNNNAAASPRLLNFEAVAMHLLFDVFTSCGVLVGSVLQDKLQIHTDSVMAVGIALITVRSVNPMFQRTLRILSQASYMPYDYVLRELAASVDGILEFHQVHFWTLGPSKEVGSFIIRIRSDANEDVILKQAHKVFAKALWSLTVQIQRDGRVDSVIVATTNNHLEEEDLQQKEQHRGLEVRDAAHII